MAGADRQVLLASTKLTTHPRRVRRRRITRQPDRRAEPLAQAEIIWNAWSMSQRIAGQAQAYEMGVRGTENVRIGRTIVDEEAFATVGAVRMDSLIVGNRHIHGAVPVIRQDVDPTVKGLPNDIVGDGCGVGAIAVRLDRDAGSLGQSGFGSFPRCQWCCR